LHVELMNTRLEDENNRRDFARNYVTRYLSQRSNVNLNTIQEAERRAYNLALIEFPLIPRVPSTQNFFNTQLAILMPNTTTLRTRVTNQNNTPVNQPISVIRNGNEVTIVAYINIMGLGADLFVSEGATYRQAAIQGLYTYWVGNMGGLNVNLQVTDIGQGDHTLRTNQTVMNVHIHSGHHHTHPAYHSGWRSLTNVGETHIYTHLPRNDEGVILRATEEQISWIMAHEFGHAMGVYDAWRFGRYGNDIHDIYSIMSRHYNQPATRLDIEMVLRAHFTGMRQYFNSTNLNIITTHAVRREE